MRRSGGGGSPTVDAAGQLWGVGRAIRAMSNTDVSRANRHEVHALRSGLSVPVVLADGRSELSQPCSLACITCGSPNIM